MPDSNVKRVKRQPVTQVTDPSELLRRSRLTPSEVRKEMHAEKLVHQAEERKIRKPWKYETEKPLAEPPDINYREMIIDDQEMIDLLLENESLHFSQRCLEYQTQDLKLEEELLNEYDDWTESMLNHAKKAGETKREEFFSKLHAVVSEDSKAVYDEWRSHKFFAGHRKRWLRIIDLQATYPSCYCTGCTRDKIRTRHEELEREMVAAGREDFKNGLKDCPCESCSIKIQAAAERHQKLREKAELSGNMNFKNGVPGCDCENCVVSKAYRAQHKKLKYEKRERGNTDFVSRVRGCYCDACSRASEKANEKAKEEARAARREAEKTLHEELKQKQVINGNIDFRAGVEGCDCCECFKAEGKAVNLQHKQLRREQWVRGNSYFDKPIPSCHCWSCEYDETFPSDLEHDETTDDIGDTQPPPKVAEEHSRNHHPTQPNSPNETPHKPRRSRIPVPVRHPVSHPVSRKPQKPSRIPVLVRRPVAVPASAQAQAPAQAQGRAQAQAQGEQQRRNLGRRMVDRVWRR